MKNKLLTAGVSALFFLSAGAQASTWTVTAKGAIQSGFDTTGVFGAANQDLTGLHYTQSITANTDPAQWSDSYNGHPYGSPFAYVDGAGPGFSDTVTVNGHSVTFNLGSTAYGEQFLANGLSANNPGYRSDDVVSYQYGYQQDGSYLSAYNSISSDTTPFQAADDFSKALTIDAGPNMNGYAYFGLFGGALSTYFNAGIDAVAVNGGTVPEPASLALFGLGLTGLAIAGRKKRA